jgi:hypothetical protein
MDVKLRYDLFNTLVHSTASYACEVWVDSKNMEAIQVVYQGFLKFLLEVRKTTIMSIVLVEFGKFPFEHFAWGQALLYYNRVSTITKDRILGKAWEAQLAMLAVGKKCWARSVKKWLLKKQSQEVAGFSTFGSTITGNDASTCSDMCALGKDCSTAVGNGYSDNAHTSNPSSRGERLGREQSVLVQHAQCTCGS